MSKSFAILREEEVKLKKLVNEKFTEATERRDSGSIDRFLKIFPLLNLHEDGMAMFCSHLSKTIEEFSNQQLGAISLDSGKRSGVAYADTLTLLYERVARTIEKEQPTVETFYGPSWLLYLIKKLQLVCDKQAVEIIHQLHEERQLDRKVQTIGFALNSRSASTAIKPDILELDTLLLELSLCSARTELYFRFLRKKMEGIMETSAPSGRALKSPPNSSKDVEVNISDIIHDSKINHLIQELIGKYIVIENYFMKESLTKAVNMDSCNSDGLTSSMADDIFFVLQKCIRRAFSSANVDGACAMLNHASSLLLTDYKEELQNKLNTCFPSGTGLDFSGMIPSKLQSKMSGSSTDKSESGKMTAMITVNDIEVTVVNVHKLTDELQAECSKLVLQVGETGKRKLDSCLADFSSVGATFKELRQSGIGKILEMILLPQIRPSINAFSSISHSFDENDLANFEVNDPFVQQLVSTLEQSLTDVKGSLLRQVYDQLLADMTSDVAILLEQQVFKCSFNQLGGVQLDKDLRMLVAYLSSQTNWPVRDKFSRLMQMATILNFETAREILDYWGPNAGPVVWRLTPSEVRKVLQLRVDFNPEDINHIKL